MTTYKILISGPPGSGKSSYLNALAGGVFSEAYSPTTTLKKVQIQLATTAGPATFEFYECNSDLICAQIIGQVDAQLVFVAPEQISDAEKYLAPIGLVSNIRSKVVVISQADRLAPGIRARFSRDPRFSVISTKEGFNLYNPLDKLLVNFPGKPTIIPGKFYGPFIILLIGRTGIGKTTWLESLASKPTPASPTKTPTVYDVSIETNKGTINFIIYDCPGFQADYWGPCVNLISKADGIFIMESSQYYLDIEDVRNYVQKYSKTIPTLEIFTQGDEFPGAQGFVVSSTDPETSKQAFILIARQILNDDSII